MEGEVSHMKRARMLSQNQIRNIVMDSDSDEEAYYISTDTKARCRVCSARGVRWCSNVSSATWRFVRTKIVSKIATQRRTFETSF